MLIGYCLNGGAAMKMWKRMLALLCAVALMAMGAAAGAEGLYFGSHPADDVYMTQ